IIEPSGFVEPLVNKSNQERIEGKKAFVTNFTKVRQQAYSTIEYEIYTIPTIPKQVDDIPLVENEDSETDPKIENQEILQDDETLRYVSTSLSNFERIETLAILLKESKRYNLDLTPKFVSCRGELIELLISSGVARYLEFKAMDKTYIYSIDAFDK
ncbi:25612_t:CDS:2, partial [Racocetra persica]